MSKTNIVFGLETTSRELDARLALASLHARRDRRIFIAGGLTGQRLATDFEGALCVGKHLIHPTATTPTAYVNAKRNGSVMVHLAEEGGVFMGDESDWRWDLNHQLVPELLQAEDFVCTWGDFQRDHYRKRAPEPGNIRTTGHPRFDLYKPRFRAIYDAERDELRRRFGRFVLWCSNFGMVNDPEGPFNTFSPMMGYIPENDDVRLRFIERWAYQQRTFAEYIQLFHKLSRARPDINFVVRPHPSDNVDFLRWSFRGVRNIHVVQEKTVAPWLLAAEAMLHDGCTTGLEAYLLGCPIVNFRPVEDGSQVFYLPNLFGHRSSKQADAIAAIETILESPPSREPSNDNVPLRAQNLLANFSEDSFASFTAVLNEAERTLADRRRSTRWSRTLANEARSLAVEEAKHLVRRAVSPRRYRTAMHARQRFPGFHKATIGRRLERLAVITGTRLEARLHGPNLLELNVA